MNTHKRDNIGEAEDMGFSDLEYNVSLEQLEEKYEEITALYDHASALVETVESDFISDPEAQWNSVEPLINSVGDAADILSEEFIHMAESIKKVSTGKVNKPRIEAAFRQIYMAINTYRRHVLDAGKQAHNAISNIADPLVEKLQRQVETVIGIFLEFIQLTIASIMNKAELDQLKARDARIALMMHNQAMQAQQQ